MSEKKRTIEKREPGFYWFRYDQEVVMLGARARGIDVDDPIVQSKLKAELADELGWQIVKVDRQGLVWCFGVGAGDMQAALQMVRATHPLGARATFADCGMHYSRVIGSWGARVTRVDTQAS